MTSFAVRDLPDASAFLAGRGPVGETGVLTERLQVYWRRGDDLRADERSHAHTGCDELFVVLRGTLTVDVEGARRDVGPRQWCHFAIGQFHRIVAVTPDVELLAIRAPSVDDKVYR